VSTENALQTSIQEAFDNAGVDYAREKALSRRDRPDFLCGDVVIEAKCRYPKKAIYRQLVRYAEHDSVAAIILVTGTAMGMPDQINGKPVYVISAGMGAIGC
jgi:hypothetical protein